MKKILIAPDSFKGSISAVEISNLLAEVLSKISADWLISKIPLGDGGEGSLTAINNVLYLEKKPVKTIDPLGRSLISYYLHDDKTAFFELALASGIDLLTRDEYNPLKTSSYGTGVLINDALDAGYEDIRLFVGSSSTNDGGTGIAQALGFKFIDKSSRVLNVNGGNMTEIHRIDTTNVNHRLYNAEVSVLCDVDNPFIGPHGAVSIYSEQKGATREDKVILEKGMSHLSTLMKDHFYIDVTKMKGAGAAGGIGGGAVCFLGAEIMSGVKMIFDVLEVEEQVKKCDIVITGEGKLDDQTKNGKVVAGLSHLCNQFGKELIVICGQNQCESFDLDEMGISKVVTLSEISGSSRLALLKPKFYLEKAGKIVAKYIDEQF